MAVCHIFSLFDRIRIANDWNFTRLKSEDKIMSSLYVFCFFATVLVLVHAQEFDHDENVIEHEYTNNEVCPKHQIKTNRQNAAISARERLVVLKAGSGFEFFPRSVSVKRCNGHCSDNLSPMPTTTKPKDFTVHLHQKGDPAPMKCVTVTVTEHTLCKCMCMKSEEDCNYRQYWNEPNCDCMCRNRKNEKSNCEAKPRMVWDDSDCACKCSKSIMQCKSGEEWSTKECDCVPIGKMKVW